MMMMAHESSPPPPPRALDQATIETVRVALVRYLATPDDGRDGVRAAINQMANEARDKSILPEQLLVVLKDLWYGLPDLKAAPDHQRSALLQQVVTLCIKEYYEG